MSQNLSQFGRASLIRYATENDSKWIMSELAKFAEFDKSMHGLFLAPQEYKDKLFKKMITEDLFLVAEVSGEMVGFICGMYFNHHFNPNIRVLAEQFWWVSESYRGTRVGYDLLSSFENIGSPKADYIQMSVLPNSGIKDSALERMGYELSEKSFLKKVARDG
jgi:hypothetical protein